MIALHWLTLLFAAVFYACGWLPAKAWLAVLWAAHAVRLGWADARDAG